MAFLLLAQRQARRASGRKRVFRERGNPLGDLLDDNNFVNRYRMPRHLILDITDLLNEELQPLTNRSQALMPVQKVMLLLRFFATGNLQLVNW